MSLYDKRFTRSMEILEQQLKPKSRSKRILPSETDPGLNMTFPRIQPAREKERAVEIDKLSMFKAHIVQSTKSSQGLGGLCNMDYSILDTVIMLFMKLLNK